MQAIYFYDGLIGRYALQETDGYLSRLWLGNRIGMVPQEAMVEETALLREAKEELDAYFLGKLKQFSLPLAPVGTDFQLQVWHFLAAIPYGETITYGQLAQRVGNPQAARAVGTANGRNPLPVFIPCHRVVGTGGKLTGYTGGLGIKEILLNVERM